MPRLAAKYKRISRDREGLALGIERQDQDLDDLAKRLGVTVVDDYFDNDISASTKSSKPRPDYQRMLADARAGKLQVILAYTTGRLTRRPREFEDLIDLSIEHGVEFEYVRSPSFDLNTAQGRRIARTLAAQDAGEAEEIAERVARQKLQAATDGRWKGGRRPYGYAADGVTVLEEEAAVVRELAGQVLAGRSLRGLAADLNKRGMTTSTGAPWRQDAIRAVLLRPRNAGLMEHRGEVIGPATWPPLLDEDMWRAVVSIVTDPDRRTSIPGRRWLLTGLAKCGVCGSPVIATLLAAKRATGNVPAYTCKAGRCVVRNAVELEQFVTSVVTERLSRPDAVMLMRDRREVPDLAEMHTRAIALRERLDGLAVAYADGAIDARQLREGSDRLRGQLEQVHAEIGEASRGSVLEGLVDAPDVGQVWATLELDRRRAVIDALMTITINKTRKGRRPGWRPGESYFDPRSVEIAWE